MDAEELSEIFADSLLPVTVFFGILAGFGILANGYVFYVYKYKYSQCNFRTFVLCLAMIDFASCLFVFPSEMYGHRIWFSYPPSANWFCKVKTVVSGAAVFTSSFVLLLISIDRFRKVCRPYGKQMKVKTALRLCLLIFGIGSVIVIPCPILFGIQTTNITYEGEDFEITSCMKDDAYKDSVWLTVYVACIYYSPVVAFMITTMVLYARLIKTIFFGSFLKFQETVIYTKDKMKDDNEESASITDNGLSDTEVNYDSDEDNTDIEMPDLEETAEQLATTGKHSQKGQLNTKNERDRSKQTDGGDEIRMEKPLTDKIAEHSLTENKESSRDCTEEVKGIAEAETSANRVTNMVTTQKDKVLHQIDEHCEQIPREADSKDKATNGETLVNKGDTNKEVGRKGNRNMRKLQPFTHVVSELKTFHKYTKHTLPKKTKTDQKSAFGNETLKRMRMKRASKKRNIKTRSLIMFVVTLIFTITTSIYFSIFTVIYRKTHVLELVSTDTSAVFFLFWRIYFVNHVINPFVYGFFDPRFRKTIRRSSQRLFRRISKFRLSSLRRSMDF